MKNKKNILALSIIMIIFIITLFGYKTIKNDTQISDDNYVGNTVEDIKQKVSQIDAGAEYETITLNNEKFLENMTDGGGQLTGYFKDGVLHKIEERLGLSYGVITYSYYFSEGDLVLIHEMENIFPYSESTGSLDYSKLELGFSGYYYIENETLVHHEVRGEKRFDQGKTIQEHVSTLVNYSKENLTLLTEDL